MDKSLSRRDFLKKTTIAGVGLYFTSVTGKDLNLLTKKDSFNPLLGVCTSISNYEIIKKCGFNYIEESLSNFCIPSDPEKTFDEKLVLLKNSSLPIYSCNNFIPGHFKFVGNETKHDEVIRWAEIGFSRARQANIKIISLGSGGARKIPDGFDRDKARVQFLELLVKLIPIAAKNDITICIEQLNHNETNFINCLAEANEIVNTVNLPHFKLLVDMYHMMIENENADEILKAGKNVYHCHIAEKQGRSAPGTFCENFKPYFSSLKKINYQGRISIECSWKDFHEQLPVAYEYLQKQINEVNN